MSKSKIEKVMQAHEDLTNVGIAEPYIQILCYNALADDQIFEQLMEWKQTRDYTIIKKIIEEKRHEV